MRKETYRERIPETVTVYATIARFIRDSTAAGRALLTAATAGDQRTALGLGTAAQSASSDFAAAVHTHDDRYFTETEINSLLSSYLTVSAAGTAYQPLDSDLTAIAALTTTTFGRSLLTQADAAAARSTFELGTLATQNGTIADYLTIASAAATYLTVSTAASTYLPLAGGALNGDILPSTHNTRSLGSSAVRWASAFFQVGITSAGQSNFAAVACSSIISSTYAGGASAAPIRTFGALYTGGTGTTNFPQFLQQPSAATGATTWSTSGTFWGVNAASGFSGNFADLRINGGSSLFCIDSTGRVITSGGVATGSLINTGTLSLPTSTDTLVGRATTDTLTNKRIQRRIVVATTATSLTPDISAADFYEYTALATALTINNPTGTPVNGELLSFRLQDNGTGRSLAWGTQFRSMTATLPTTTVANKTHRVLCEWNSGDATWDVLAVAAQP